ncbi:MAG: Dyp-type peroxidase [Rhodospirillales bacterium]|nr:Dyp-type peroxidase [Rhodospirillales bacterium]
MNTPQSGILAPVPGHARYLEFGAVPDADPVPVLRALASRQADDELVVGIGPGLVGGLGRSIEGLRPLPSLSGPGCDIPSTQADLWCWVRGSDRGRIFHAAHAVELMLEPAFRCDRMVDGFKYDRGLDLTGYEDGTENPEGDKALKAAIVDGGGPGLDGSSFVATQKWVHDLDYFAALPQDERDNIIGRRISDNEELADAPASAHVKRTEQESFDPAAFVLRRSMPWADSCGEGLMFVAFGKSFDAFEVQLRRMTGQEDNVVDGMFRFSRPVSGSYFWCPPVSDGHLVLSAIGI